MQGIFCFVTRASKRRLLLLLGGALSLGAGSTAWALNITPASVSQNVTLGSTVSRSFTVTPSNEEILQTVVTEGGQSTPQNYDNQFSLVTVSYNVTVNQSSEHCTAIFPNDGVVARGRIVGCEFNCATQASAPVNLTYINPLTVATNSQFLSGAPGQTVRFSDTWSGGRAPYRATSQLGANVTPGNGNLGYEYRIPSGASGTLTDTVVISGVTTSCGGDSAEIRVTINVLPGLSASPPSLALEGAPGQQVSAAISIGGGTPPNQASARLGTATVSGSTVSYSYTIPAGAAGTLSDTITVTDSNGQSVTVPVTIAVSSPIAVNPSALVIATPSLVGVDLPVTRTFSVSGGSPPYSLAVLGNATASVSPTRLAGPGDATYSVQIPANTPAATTVRNTIVITDSTGARTELPVTVNIAPSDALSGRPDLTQNERSVGRAVENVCPQLATMQNRTAAQQDLLDQCTDMIVNASSSGIPNTLNEVTNEKAEASASAAVQVGTQQFANIGSRLAALRRGSTGLDIQGLTFNIDGQRFTGSQLSALVPTPMTGGAASGDTTGSFGNWGFFLNGSFNFGDKDATAKETGFDYNSYAITGGADYRFSDQFIAGGAFGYAENDVNFDTDGGGLDTTSWHLAGYATYYLSERVYLDGIVEYGWQDYDSSRNITYQITSLLDPVRRQARATYDGNQFGASLGAGYDLNEGPLSYGVYGRVGYLQVDVDGFTEQGAGGLNLQIDGFDTTSVTTTLGARVSRVFNTSRAVLVPQARVEWEHEFDDDASSLVARFAADPTATAFDIFTDSPDRNYFRIGLGLSAVFPHGMSAFVNYNTLLDKSDWTDHMFDVGIRREFY